jgi:repressor LexA
MTRGLTKMQSRALDFIASGDLSPSLQEIADHLGLVSRSGAARLVDGLEERGFVRRIPHRPRSLVVVKDPSAARQSASARLAAFDERDLITEIRRRGYRVDGIEMRRAAAGPENVELGLEPPGHRCALGADPSVLNPTGEARPPEPSRTEVKNASR